MCSMGALTIKSSYSENVLVSKVLLDSSQSYKEPVLVARLPLQVLPVLDRLCQYFNIGPNYRLHCVSSWFGIT